MNATRQRRRWQRAVVVAAVLLLLVGGALASLTVFLNGQGLREKVQAALTSALGRPVSIASLQFFPATGSAVARDLRIGEDPRFGSQPFVAAAQVRLGLELWPLLLRRQVRIASVDLRAPQVRLLRNAAGEWNYLSLRQATRPPQGAATAQARRGAPTFAVSRATVTQGQVLVQTAGPDAPGTRMYDGVDITVTGFQTGAAFPFRVAARLPGGGSALATGSAGPWTARGSPAMPIAAHMTATHLDLAAAGLVGADARLTGTLQTVAADVDWSGHGFSVGALTVHGASLRLGLPRATVAAATRPGVWGSLLDHVHLASAHVTLDQLLIARRDGRTVTLQAIDATVLHLAAGTPVAFSASASLGGGSVRAAGTLFVRASSGEEHNAVIAQSELHVRHVDMAGSGLLSRGSAMRGSADADLQLATDAGRTTVNGTARLDRLVLARNGQAAPGPVSAAFRVIQRSPANTPGAVDPEIVGTVDRADISFGGGVLHVAGTYRAGGPETAVDLHVAGTALPVDGIEAFLPAAGVQLPEGSRLAGGTTTLALAVQGSPADLRVSGPVRLDGTNLTGFNLGSKLASLARFTGGHLGSVGTTGTSIRSLSVQLHTGAGQVRTDDLNADIAGLGRITGAGSVGEGATLHYTLLLKLEEVTAGAGGGAGLARSIAGGLPGGWAAKALQVVNALASGPLRNGIPLLVGGTARHPSIAPDLNALFPAPAQRTQPAGRSPWPTPPAVQSVPRPEWPGGQTPR